MRELSAPDVSGRPLIFSVVVASSSISHAASPENAANSCNKIQGLLPTEAEYEFLSSLGDWSVGVDMRHEFWAMADGKVLAPDLRNPSPIRLADEIRASQYHFYCVR